MMAEMENGGSFSRHRPSGEGRRGTGEWHIFYDVTSPRDRAPYLVGAANFRTFRPDPDEYARLAADVPGIEDPVAAAERIWERLERAWSTGRTVNTGNADKVLRGLGQVETAA